MKIEKDQLDKLRALHDDASRAKTELADVTLSISSLKERKKALIQKADISDGMLRQFQDELASKYGFAERVKIDMITGDVNELH